MLHRFTSTKCYLDNDPKAREELENELRIPRMVFDRMYVQSNGFAGHNAWLDDNEEVESYSKWNTGTAPSGKWKV
jgi:hypothetical protein